MKPVFFSTPEKFRKWLTKNHDKKTELWVGYYKVATGKPSINWSESVDQALCFGWIDGIRKSLDDESYVIRFTPRRSDSIWSAVNLAKVKQLTKLGLMEPPGLAAHEKRTAKKSIRYSYEQEDIELTPAFQSKFKSIKAAWKFFSESPPSYRKPATWWIMSAKRQETQLRRLDQLIQFSAKGERIPPLARPAPIKKKK